MSINLKNYKSGLIKGYELAYQDINWYKDNKNNFCNSLRQKFPYLLPKYAENTSIKNFLAFLPDEMIRFGTLEQITLKIKNRSYTFWICKIPPGMSLYHSSRSLGLNHSDFPIIGYKNDQNVNENKLNAQNICKTPIGQDLSSVCTYVSYYSTPYLTKGYLNKDTGFGGNSVKYAYGINPFSRSDKNAENRSLYNDRLKVKANIIGKKIEITNLTEGVSAYKTQDYTNLLIFAIDDILIDRPDLGRENLKTFYKLLTDLKSDIIHNFNIDPITFNRILDIYLSVSGIGSLQDNIDNLIRDYPQAKNIEENFRAWIRINADFYDQVPLSSAGRLQEFRKYVDIPANEIPGFRFSTFEHDKIILNLLSYVFEKYSSSTHKITGFISSSLYVYSKGKGDITTGEILSIKNLSFYLSSGYFHSELGLFFAPDILFRDRNNIFDLEYGINYLGIKQEFRKFKTTNLLGLGNGFHQGHLLEHNTWVGLIASHIWKKDIFLSRNSQEIRPEIYLLAGFFHDLGKAGECKISYAYKNLDPQWANISVCESVYDNERIGFKYHTLAEHPEIGYEYMKGYKAFKKYTLDINNVQYLYFQDWEKFFEHLNIDDFERRLIRISAGAHWYFGDFFRKYIDAKKIVKNEDTGKPDKTDGVKKLYIQSMKLANEYLRKVEIFFNDEFFNLDKNVFKQVLLFLIIISISDIYGSEYTPQIISKNIEGLGEIINYLPNIPTNNNEGDSISKLVSNLITTAINLAENNTPKKKIFTDLEENVEEFINICFIALEKFTFNPNNNYSLLFNLQNSYANLSDIYAAYPNKFPKVIVFDLDETLLQTQFSRRDSKNLKVTYKIYTDTYKIIEECQNLRSLGIKIALATRHYAPLSLKELLLDGNEALYYKNFDFIVSRYTGTWENLSEDFSEDFFVVNGYPHDGFIMDTTGKYYNIPDNSKFMNLYTKSKEGHFNLISKKFGVKYTDILAFDDDQSYFREGTGLGSAKNVFISAALLNKDFNHTGLKYDLFKNGIAYYVFNKNL